MDDHASPSAWVKMPSEEETRRMMGGANPYDFGFIPSMARLIGSHKQIAPFFGALFGRIMFGPGVLQRPEREMIAAVAAAAQDCKY